MPFTRDVEKIVSFVNYAMDCGRTCSMTYNNSKVVYLFEIQDTNLSNL